MPTASRTRRTTRAVRDAIQGSLVELAIKERREAGMDPAAAALAVAIEACRLLAISRAGDKAKAVALTELKNEARTHLSALYMRTN